MFTQAIVRPPAPNFFEGLTTAGLGAPDYQRALAQHEAYCTALERCGLKLIRLEPDLTFPDSIFVEDTAVIAERCAILTRPGAANRLGEVESMRAVLTRLFPSLLKIEAPGTLDGGDICEAGDHFFIGISERTNEAGAGQLAKFLATVGYSASFVNILSQEVTESALTMGSLLHLKSGIAYLDKNRLVITEALAGREEFDGYDLVRVHSDEQYAANCVMVNDRVLVAKGFPALEEKLRGLGYEVISLDMSEFQKMDGGLSCLSLRF